MQKKKLALAVLSTMVFSTAPAFAASNDLFNDVPSDHWAYSAVEQLAKDGILTGYGDKSFQGDKVITRYEMAQMIANARTHVAKATPDDKKLIDKLSDEFDDDLSALGVRVQRLEKKISNVRITGSFAQKFGKEYHAGYSAVTHDDNTPSEHKSKWEKELRLNIDANVPKTALNFHSTFVTLFQSLKGNGFNQEESYDESWNNGHDRSNTMRPETYFVEGPIDKTGLEGQFGAIRPDPQQGFVNHAVMKGGEIGTIPGKKNRFSFFTGRLDVKDIDRSDEITKGSADHQFTEQDIDWDRGNFGVVQTETSYSQNYYIKQDAIDAAAASVTNGSAASDFLRHHKDVNGGSAAPISSDRSYYVTQTATGSNWIYDWNNPTYDFSNAQYSISGKTVSTPTRRRTLTGFIYGHQFSDRTDMSLGYYAFHSGAYDQNYLRIYSADLNQKLGKKANLYAAVSHGNQDGYDTAWTAELQFNGAPNMPAADNHRFGYYIGYRYLAPDALVRTIYEDGAQIGQRGWEGGLYYNFCPNLQGTVKYFNGSSITNPGQDRSRYFGSLTLNF